MLHNKCFFLYIKMQNQKCALGYFLWVKLSFVKAFSVFHCFKTSCKINQVYSSNLVRTSCNSCIRLIPILAVTILTEILLTSYSFIFAVQFIRVPYAVDFFFKKFAFRLKVSKNLKVFFVTKLKISSGFNVFSECLHKQNVFLIPTQPFSPNTYLVIKKRKFNLFFSRETGIVL